MNDARRTEAKAAIGAIITAEHAYYLRSPDLLGTGVPTYTSDLAELQRVGLDITDADRTWDFTITRADESGFAVSAVLTTTASSSNPIAVDYTYTRGESGSFTPWSGGRSSMTGSLERGGPPRRIPQPDERGVGLVEVVVATVIAVIAILALAYTFGTGRGLVNSYEAARVGLAAAQHRMEALSAAPDTSTELGLGTHPPSGDLPGAGGREDRGLRIVDRRGLRRPGRRDGHPGLGPEARDREDHLGRTRPHETVTLTRLFPFY